MDCHSQLLRYVTWVALGMGKVRAMKLTGRSMGKVRLGENLLAGYSMLVTTRPMAEFIQEMQLLRFGIVCERRKSRMDKMASLSE